MGASAVKLLVYYHPESRQAAGQEKLVSQVAEACAQADLPLFLEPLSYSPDPKRKKLSSAELRQVVVETARRLTPLGADILKAEFPLNIKEEPDEAAWAAACEDLTRASRVPWVLLSAGVDFETFMRQVQAACRSGASGVLAGRAIWKEAVDMSGSERLDFLRETAARRMEKVRDLCDALARPWTACFPAAPVPEGWYREYPEL
jgi:tagatose-1,6-bisphosphate aldolase